MTDRDHDCTESLKQHIATRAKPYHFLDSGLPNVYLSGVKYWVCAKCGAQSAEIPAPEQLMNVIGESVVMKQGILTGHEVRFLRKRVGKKAADFAALINKTPEHFSKLETGALPLQEPTDKLIRLTYGLLSKDKELLTRLAPKVEEWLNAIAPGKKPPERIQIKKAGKSWSTGS
jgi:putative zinc finger/helix-turn-helix YgiT family protein